ncbi:MAG: DNA-directed RNA polymerase subunit beta' [Alphaproteobacteria bacterium]|nr:DNA-directed RNA polymerase subunit beta' [Alphaproteobacteria bacterium]
MKSTQEILDLELALLKLENLHASFDYLRIRIASPTRIKSWAQRTLPSGEIVGEITRPETINFRTHQPEVYGLFCEKIFGPIKNWKCRCGKYNGFVIDRICDECEVEIIESRVRRYRMGYIELTCPITHLWYMKGNPNYILTILQSYDENLKIVQLEKIVYFSGGSKILDSEHPLYEFCINENYKTENDLSRFRDTTGTPHRLENLEFPLLAFRKRKGAEILKKALEGINIKNEISKARTKIISGYQADIAIQKQWQEKDKKIMKRLRLLESFHATKINPSWMILTVLPVLPPNLRPLVELENGRLVAADVNEIYRLILTRNQRLADFIYRFIAPDLISVQGRKLLQEAVDSLIDNSRVGSTKTLCLNNKALRSLTEILEGKQGRFRQSLLGKRVDYSGRSVIVVGPNLRLNQCGLPYEMATELFQPFLINELLKEKIQAPSHNTKLAHIIIRKNKPFIWRLLEILTKKYCILLNRAPTLHRFGIQAFNPVIILGQAIQLHPLVCTGFNADFDGDQMAVHLPLYDSSQLEARTMMRPSYNLLSPSNGEVILKPTQDMVIGCYYLTLMVSNQNFILKKWFPNENNALIAFYQKKITIHTPILVKYSIVNFSFIIKDQCIQFINSEFLLKDQNISIHKVFQVGPNKDKYYLITNIGILICNYKQNNTYSLTDLFLETTPGRLIFSTNIKNILMK